MKIEQEPYGKLPDGRPVVLFHIASPKGITIGVTSFGAILTSVRLPDREGAADEVTLGFDSLEGYIGPHPYFGATVGRFANRIALGRFELGGKVYQLARNNGENHLHGGDVGFDKRLWEAFPFTRGEAAGVRFTYVSPDGEEGYPGTLTANVTYTLTESGSLEIRYEATTDRATPVNLTNHTYWNLKGAGNGEIGDHLLTLYADSYLPAKDDLMPTGEIVPVESTPFDFRSEKRIDTDFPTVSGYDNCFVVSQTESTAAIGKGEKPLLPVADVHDPSTGRGFRLSGTQPGVQFYTGNGLDGIAGHGGTPYGPHTGFCLETQSFPDAPNRPSFPPAILEPGQKYDELAKLDFYCN